MGVPSKDDWIAFPCGASDRVEKLVATVIPLTFGGGLRRTTASPDIKELAIEIGII